MFDLVKIGLVLAAAAALAWMWHNFVESYREQGRAELRPKIEALETDVNTLRSANGKLTGDLSRLAGERDQCNRAVDQIRAEGDAVKERKNRALADAQSRADELASRNRSLEEQLRNPPKGGTCEQDMARIDASLREFARQLMRDDAQAGGGGQRRVVTPGEDSGAGTLRIGR